MKQQAVDLEFVGEWGPTLGGKRYKHVVLGRFVLRTLFKAVSEEVTRRCTLDPDLGTMLERLSTQSWEEDHEILIRSSFDPETDDPRLVDEILSKFDYSFDEAQVRLLIECLKNSLISTFRDCLEHYKISEMSMMRATTYDEVLREFEAWI